MLTIFIQGLDNPAFRLAVQVCNNTSDRLQRHVCQYFTEIIVQHAPDEELDDIRKAHELVKQLNKFCSPLLHLVVPQLEEELRVEDLTLRTMATQVLGGMFADKGGADLLRKYPTTWSLWNLRRNDKSPNVRLAFVEAAHGLLVGLPEQREFVEGLLFQFLPANTNSSFRMQRFLVPSCSIPMRKSGLLFASCTRNWITRLRYTTSRRRNCDALPNAALTKR